MIGTYIQYFNTAYNISVCNFPIPTIILCSIICAELTGYIPTYYMCQWSGIIDMGNEEEALSWVKHDQFSRQAIRCKIS